MVHLKRGDEVKVMCDDCEIDRAKVEVVDCAGGVIFSVSLTSRNSGSCDLNYNPSKSGWTLHMAEGWSARQPNGAVYSLEVVEPATVEMVSHREGAD